MGGGRGGEGGGGGEEGRGAENGSGDHLKGIFGQEGCEHCWKEREKREGEERESQSLCWLLLLE